MPTPKRILRGLVTLPAALNQRIRSTAPQRLSPGSRLPLDMPGGIGAAAASTIRGGATAGGGGTPGGGMTGDPDAPAYPEAIVTLDDPQTLTQKRIMPRADSIASSATPAIDTDAVDYFSITALAVNITSMTTNLTGTPTAGQRLHIAITAASGTPSIAWGSGFGSSSLSLPTTASTTRLDLEFIWNEASSKWRLVGSS